MWRRPRGYTQFLSLVSGLNPSGWIMNRPEQALAADGTSTRARQLVEVDEVMEEG